jgi:ABC-2 type transport system ATP-binding protein
MALANLALGCPATAAAAVGGGEPLVVVENISKRYGRKNAVADVTLTLQAGEVCGFIGPNGGGKTSTLRMLAGILKPDEGHGRVLGFDILRDAAKIRERIGYLSQKQSLYAELSVFENLRFRAEIYGLRNPHAEVEAAICEFGLEPWAHSRTDSLSGGWARRPQLAASLLHSPRLVLLDEPTAGLDALARQEVWRHVEELAASGSGVILCTHDLAEAERCSNIVFFADGQVVNAGVPDEIAAESPVVALLLSCTGARRLVHEVSGIAGVIASYPQGESLRVLAWSFGEENLRRFAASRGASLAPTRPRLEDAVLAWSLPAGRPRS